MKRQPGGKGGAALEQERHPQAQAADLQQAAQKGEQGEPQHMAPTCFPRQMLKKREIPQTRKNGFNSGRA